MILWGHCGAGRKISTMSKDPAFEDGQLLIWNHTSVTVKKNLSRRFRSCLEWGGKPFPVKLYVSICVRWRTRRILSFLILEHLTHLLLSSIPNRGVPEVKIEKSQHAGVVRSLQAGDCAWTGTWLPAGLLKLFSYLAPHWLGIVRGRAVLSSLVTGASLI